MNPHHNQDIQRQQWKRWLASLSGTYQERDAAELHLQQVSAPAFFDFIAEELPGATGRTSHVLLQLAQQPHAYTPALATYLAETLDTEQRKQRDAMVVALQQMGQTAKGEIYKALQGDTAIQDFHRKLLIDLLCPLTGEDIDPLLQSIAEDNSTTVRLHAIEALGQRKSLSAIPLLVKRLAPIDLDSYEESADAQRRLRQAAALALGMMGEVAAAAIPSLEMWLTQHNVGDKRVAIEALGGIGTSEAIALVLPYLDLPTGLSQQDLKVHAKYQKSAALALQKRANPDALDRIVALYLNDQMANYSWRALADTIVVMVTEGLGPVDGFAWIRTLLEGAPNERLWRLLCALVNAWPEDERNLVLDYIDAHIDHWDDELRLVTYEATNSIGHWRLWWPQPPNTDPAPSWPLVRALHIKLHADGSRSMGFLSYIQSKYGQQLTHLTLTHFELHRDRAVALASIECPALRHIALHTPTTTLRDLDQHLFNASWIKQLKTLQIGAFTSKWTDRYPEYRKLITPSGEERLVELSCELLTQDPRVAHLNFSLEQRIR